MKPGIYYDISNEDYHKGGGVSKSQLDDIAKSPAFYKWKKNAPIDTEKLKALDMGTALHCLLLEPDEFIDRFIEAPEFNRRSNQGRQDEKDFLKNCENTGKTVMDYEQHRKLKLMKESVMAHHAARYFLEADGYSEASIYWSDTDTDELCRIRPDKFLLNQPVIIDVKKVADMERFSRHVEEFRYHVQSAMYQEGFLRHFGESPVFLFIAVSETIDCARYPVHVYELEPDDIDVGFNLFKSNLQTFHECRVNDDWGGIEVISRPDWAKRRD
ncbi:PD-(D/E)XK nuclease-like domain-containing protein [Xenorhabdus littoralis]|uniref:PD-(D/E)XK nuclease-like domain-containing protein n=1 Tax=Xenorhabdus littoralis TaxID=2582835 RepID=UPI0029E80F0D|nr:PD-(D/E)XK nuclease-like domain-containing protein [Xenorhabdus sp. psl]MDX7992621.1 exodeoxyribonuclease VIII [Xenorhabdus sp. psl]